METARPSPDDLALVPPERCIEAAAAPDAPSPQAEEFYAEVLRELAGTGIPFLLAGAYALAAYTGLRRPTKDMDIFCTAGDFLRVLDHFRQRGDEIEIEDERWIGKVKRGPLFFDVIFASGNGTMPVNEEWFAQARQAEVFGVPVRLVSPTELVWSKMFIQLRHRFDGPDIMHVILRQHEHMDWKRLLAHMEPHWELLLAHLVTFRWIYPSERNAVPRWLMEELADRLRRQLDMPLPRRRICRGPMLSRFDYQTDVLEWDFSDHTGGEGHG